MNAILVGMAGKWAMLKAIFGSDDQPSASPASQKTASRPMTPDLFDAVFGGKR